MEKLQVHLILEILGRPKENVQDALAGLVKKLGSESGIKIMEEVQHPPVPVKDTKDLFTSFAQITVELDSIAHYFGLIFAYMPANIELISPEKINIKNDDFNLLGNKLVQRLHDYDAIAKNIIAERDILMQKLKEFAPHLFKQQAHPVQQEQKSKKLSNKKGKKQK